MLHARHLFPDNVCHTIPLVASQVIDAIFDRDGLAQKRLINYCAIYVALGFVGTELGLFLTCIPLTNYWAAPTPNRECISATDTPVYN